MSVERRMTLSPLSEALLVFQSVSKDNVTGQIEVEVKVTRFIDIAFQALLLFQAYNVEHRTRIGRNLLLVGDGDVLAGNLLDTGSETITETR
jgi:hypothetical protein